jgi:hypothetical protein
MTMNKLYKHVFVILLITGFSLSAYSQNFRSTQKRKQNNYTTPVVKSLQPLSQGMRRIQVVKENFIGQQLSLSKEQGAKFWPIYRNYQNEMYEIRRLKRLNNSDAQANGPEQVKKDLDYDAQMVDIRKHYNEEFLKILPSEKVSQLLKSEREFNDELVRKLHEQNPNKQD